MQSVAGAIVEKYTGGLFDRGRETRIYFLFKILAQF